jgi:hypothetical protein
LITALALIVKVSRDGDDAKMALIIASDRFEIHETPLEKIIFESANTLYIEFNDVDTARVKLRFRHVYGITITHIDILDYNMIEVGDDFPRRLLEVIPLQWASYVSEDISVIAKGYATFPKWEHNIGLRHFILPFQDQIVEILCNNFVIESTG